MDFVPSLEQTMLRDSARQFLHGEYSFEQRRARIAATETNDARALWSQFAELGWVGVGIPENLGGLGGGAVEQAILMEELGGSLVVEPFVAAAVLAPRAILASGSLAHQHELLPRMADGSLQMALAWQEHGSRYAVDAPATRAQSRGDGYVISGAKMLVLGGHSCDKLIVSARVEEGVALFVMNATVTGVTRRPYALMDHQWVADFDFADVVLPRSALLVAPGRAVEVLEEAVDHAIVVLCAGLVGAMERAIEMTVGYMKQRRQFGKSLADFQVQQHRSADMFIATDSARSMLFAALSALAEPADVRKRTVSAAKVKITEAAKSVTGDAIHQHGGMGMTIEYPVGHYLRAALVAEKLFGDSDTHLQRFMNASLTGE